MTTPSRIRRGTPAGVSEMAESTIFLDSKGTKTMRHFVNLSNGLRCPHIAEIKKVNFLRLQSTHCEQKLWAKVLENLGPEFLVAAAQGIVVVHDRSEKPRVPRALWQGVDWVGYALQRAWFGPILTHFNRWGSPMRIARICYSRNGMLISRYWEEQYRQLPRRVKNNLKYYRQFVTVPEVMILGCHRL